MSVNPPSFPQAQQAQIIRSNQRDLFQVSALREQTENVLRSWLGTRWLTRWDKEIDFAANVLYYGLTAGLDNRGGIYRHLASFHSESETALTPTESGVNPPPHIALIFAVKMGFADSPDVEDRSITAQDTHDP
ncbi:hypothetical protein ONZ51_g3371 [Trametes cubensis]|uniref:Uncharacterized protein n=1 Tax=Trametes cubensis TaxID=1111947 RepID=A0AAD7TXT2_9APHY|nr:hypothetical protein ONZ51_g3371 [Trametes cubensis]